MCIPWGLSKCRVLSNDKTFNLQLSIFNIPHIIYFCSSINYLLLAKGSYFAKHKERLSGTEEGGEQVRLPMVKVSEETRRTFEEGRVILLDKPLHWTSFDAVRKIRNTIKIKKVGHAGTLDPLATGLLIICTGKFTKKINEFMAAEKQYTGSFTLGAVTPTYDKESAPENFKDFTAITTEQIKAAAQEFVGALEQFPPVYSAIKKDGVALYELARRGEEVELKARSILIRSFEIISVELPIVQFKVVCSTGTYIRSLAHDMGTVLGCGAYLSELRRTAIGEHRVEGAVSVEEFLEDVKQVTTELPEGPLNSPKGDLKCSPNRFALFHKIVGVAPSLSERAGGEAHCVNLRAFKSAATCLQAGLREILIKTDN